MKKGNNLKRVKNENCKSIRELIYNRGPISRTEMSDYLELTPSTITSKVAELIDLGLVTECQEPVTKSNTLGRKRVHLDIIPSFTYLVGVDMGPYATYIVISDLRGKIIIKAEYPICSEEYTEAVKTTAEHIREVIAKTQLSASGIYGVGISIPGMVDDKKGMLICAARHNWTNKKIAEDMTKELNMPCVVENNARCKVWSVRLFEKKNLPDTFSYLLVAKGIACPMVINGSFYVGAQIGAGEVGHMKMQVYGPVCPTCGHQGCLEAFASETAIEAQCRDIKSDLLEGNTMQDILKAYAAGDKEVAAVLEKAAVYLGYALSNVINFINPGLVLVDGYFFAEKKLRDIVKKTACDNIYATNGTGLDIDFVEFDKYRSARGAAAYAVKRFILVP